MTEEETKNFLANDNNNLLVRIGFIDEKAEPNVIPTGYYFDSVSNKIYIPTMKGSKKVSNLRKNNVIAYCIDDPVPPFKGVRGKGIVKIHQDVSHNISIAKYPKLPIDCFEDRQSGREVLEAYDDSPPREAIPPGDSQDPEEYIADQIEELMYAPFNYDGEGIRGIEGTPPGKWYRQPKYVEAWLEEASLGVKFKKILEDRCINIVLNHGFSSLTFAYKNCRRLEKIADRHANLFNAYLADTNLSGANLADANLSCANLSGANLSHARLTDTNLSDANLSCANLSHARLTDTNLYAANLSCVNLSDANLSHARLIYSMLISCIQYDNLICNNSDFDKAIIDSKKLEFYLKDKNAKNVPEAITNRDSLKMALKYRRIESNIIEKLLGFSLLT